MQRLNTPTTRFVLALAAGLAALGYLCWRFGLADLAVAFREMTPAYLLAYVIFGCAACVGYGLRWRAIARTLGDQPRLPRLIAARLAGDAVGALLPAGRVGGDPIRVALLYADGVGGVRASAGVAIDRLIEVIGNMVFAIAAVTVFSFAHGVGASHDVLVMVLVTLCGLLVALGILVAMLRRGRRPLQPLYSMVARYGSPRWSSWLAALRGTEGQLIRFLREQPRTCVWGLLGSLAIEALVVIEYHCLFAAFAVAHDLPTLLMMLVASGLARVAPAPAGLGALEASQVAVLAVASGQPAVGFVAGLLLRLHESLWTAAGFVVLSLQGVSLARLRLLAATRKAAAA